MRVAVASDLHLEFGSLELKNDVGADVLVLSGDVMVAEDIRKPCLDTSAHRYIMSTIYKDFFDSVCYEFKNVIYVAGNHEFYGGKFFQTVDVLRKYAEDYPNLHYLENDTVRIDDVTFVGGTLWTNMNNHDALTMYHVQAMMNDYRDIVNDQKGYTKLRPVHTVERHCKTLQYFRTVLQERHDEKFVVCSHHGPTFQSIDDYYRNDTIMNGAYCSDLSEFILDHPQIKLWTHGHIHDDKNYKVGDTTVLCNPRGYKGYETRVNTFALQCVEV